MHLNLISKHPLLYWAGFLNRAFGTGVNSDFQYSYFLDRLAVTRYRDFIYRFTLDNYNMHKMFADMCRRYLDQTNHLLTNHIGYDYIEFDSYKYHHEYDEGQYVQISNH